MNTEHITLYYELRVEVYTDIAENANAHVAHIADWMLERWWVLFTEAHSVEVVQTGAFC